MPADRKPDPPFPGAGADYEDTVSSRTTADGPKAPPRDKSPEHQYPEAERATGVNRTDAKAPGGPVNIPVKGKPDDSGAEAAGQSPDQATGKGSRDASGGLAQE
ncbi:hypothetical protein GCM10011504_02470 [Siccirubricoccus deserti]|uniref:Uncharacterized protein n=1 Tax=Siccirubricoccus deserti TaxID=2013562 RepID=A0A9X0QX74_9PROT|nr:hypothetical protein [Siccirubricoccus deserti]MBC4014252.1 hypothetical protein [Siccirubricoccus deserti]GGC27828.1 hypothetical protein GCM10011504_02470 [Siccirubricoccus deserti]